MGEGIAPGQIMQALRDGLNKAVGPLKPVPWRGAPGKFESKVYQCKPGYLKPVAKVLQDLDFTVTRLDTQKTCQGIRLEVNGRSTYVHYSSVAGTLVISSNAEVIDI